MLRAANGGPQACSPPRNHPCGASSLRRGKTTCSNGKDSETGAVEVALSKSDPRNQVPGTYSCDATEDAMMVLHLPCRGKGPPREETR